MGVSYHPSKAQINFTMCPDIEGNFFCGDISAMTRSANNLTLVAAPTLRKAYVDCYSASVGEVVTLACPFRRGRLLQYYSFSWLQGFSTVFNSADVNSASAGFIANLSDFSLTIPSVTLSHEDVYRCLLVVSNPLGANAFSGPESDDIDLFVLEGENSTSYKQSVCSHSSYVVPTTYVTPTSTPTEKTPATEVEMGRRGHLIYIMMAVPVAVGILTVAVAGVMMYRWRTKCGSKHNVAERGSNSHVDRPTAEMNTVNTGRSNSHVDRLTPEMNMTDTVIPNGTGPGTDTSSMCVQVPYSVPTVSGSSSSLSIADAILANLAPHPEAGSIQSEPSTHSVTLVGSSDGDPILQRPSSLPRLSVDGRSACEHPNGPGVATVLASSTEASHTASRERSVPTELPISAYSSRRLLSSNTTPGHTRMGMGLVTSPDSQTRTRSCPSQSADTVNLLRQIEDFQDDSDDFVFIGPTRVVACDSGGGKYKVPDHDITFRIPPEALDGIVEFEVGIPVHGSFRFPPNLRPISAIVWLAVHDRSGDKSATFVFKKPVEILMPHFLNLTNSDIDDKTDELGLGFIRTAEEMDPRERLIFTEGPREEVSYQQRHAKIRTKHFCFVCLSAKKSAIPERSRYLLTRVLPDPVRVLQWDMNFCISFDLESFVEMIKEQYPQQGMKFTTISFQFAPMAGDEKLKIMLDHKFDTAGWRIAFQSSQQVMMSAVHDIWENDVSDLQARVKFKAYPPRITAAVSGDAAFDNVTETVSFEGALVGDLSRGVNLMLPTDHVDKNQERLNFLRTQSQPVPESHSQIAIARANSAPQNVVVAVPDEPTTQELVEVMKKIAGKYRSWHILFQTLGIPDDCREEILQEQISFKTKILRMLNTWVYLNRHNGRCTRFNLATILEQTDSSLRPAARLLQSPREYMQIENS
jgi:hypothetical protein